MKAISEQCVEEAQRAFTDSQRELYRMGKITEELGRRAVKEAAEVASELATFAAEVAEVMGSTAIAVICVVSPTIAWSQNPGMA